MMFSIFTYTTYLVIAGWLLVMIIGLLVIYVRQKIKLGSLAGKKTYEDREEKPGEVLLSKTLPLIGKPDFIIKKGDMLIPVECKSSKTPQTPWPSHVAQLMAYCMLVEVHFGKKPPYGIIRYEDREFEIEYNDTYKDHVKKTIQEILHLKKEKTFDSKSFKNICRNCKAELISG